MRILRTILAIPVTILFFPIALILCFGIALILFPEMIIDCFEEVSGQDEINKRND